MRRIVDALVALVGLFVTSPLSVVAAAAIRLSSAGPVLFRARRSGRDGDDFTMYKFRTMHAASGPPAEGARITGGADVRIFAVGRWLRRLKIDELPQLINVVSGQMALVGPRPEDPTIVAQHYTPLMRESLRVRPGLTSPGTLDYFADETSLPSDPAAAEQLYVTTLLPRKIAADLVYVHNRTWGYDLQLIVRTLGGIVGLHDLFPAARRWERAEAQRILRDITAEAAVGADVQGHAGSARDIGHRAS